jgi:hypothetical protein
MEIGKPKSPVPGEARNQSEPCPPDCDLPENSPENLDVRLDHAIEETFPTSDPISVTITKQAVAEVPREAASATPDSQRRLDQDQAEQETAEKLLDGVRETLQEVTQTASGIAHDAYDEGRRRVRQARERYPQAEQYYQEGRRANSQRAAKNPLMSLLLAAAGYVVAWMLHHQRRERGEHVPDYGRTTRSYAPHRDAQRGR